MGMVSGDHFQCSCGYEWRTRKDVGKPSVCPHCKTTYISNLSEEERQEETRLERIEEKRRKAEQNSYEKELRDLKKKSYLHYFLYRYRVILLLILTFVVFLVIISTAPPKEITVNEPPKIENTVQDAEIAQGEETVDTEPEELDELEINDIELSRLNHHVMTDDKDVWVFEYNEGLEVIEEWRQEGYENFRIIVCEWDEEYEVCVDINTWTAWGDVSGLYCNRHFNFEIEKYAHILVNDYC